MDFSLTEDEEAVRGLFEDFCAREVTSERVRSAEPLGFDPDMWKTLARMGAVSMGVPGKLGGGDASLLDLALASQQLGRKLAPVPFVEAAVAALALAETDPPPAILGRVLDGTLIPTIALRPVPPGGVAPLVPAGAVADVLVALAGRDLLAVVRAEGGPPPASPQNLGSSPLADWDTGAERIVLATGDDALGIWRRAILRWEVLTAAALVGLAGESLAICLAYVLERRAFGGLIARFQAIQHRLSDISARLDGTELLAYEAAWALDAGTENAEALADMAFLAGSELAVHASREALQFHGGYGFAMEYDIQLYWRRARAWPLAIGSSRTRYHQLATNLFGV